MDSKKILLVEDEQVLADVLEAKLKKEGYETNVAYEGEDGYKKINEWKPDLILLDIVLPKMNGYEILEKLKADGNTTPVIIISNSGQPVEIERTKSLGAKDYLIKAQFDPEEVITKVNTFLGVEIKPQETTPAPSAPSTSEKKIKVLLVEDDKFLRDICGTKLIKEGFEIIEAVDGQEVLKKIIKDKPDIVLLDIVLPSMNGFEALSQIRSYPDLAVSKTPVLMLSNLGQDDDVKRAMELGASDYLIKSNFSTQEITDKIRRTLKI